MFENWQADQMDDAELAKNQAYLIGSFWAPEQVKKLLGESGQTHASSDEDLKVSSQMVKSGIIPGLTQIPEKKTSSHRKRKRKIKAING